MGRIVTTWIKDGALWGRIAFAETPNGILAEEMVSRGELRSVSAGYDVERWSVTDADGNPIDQEAAQGPEEDDRPAYTVFEHRSRNAVPLQDYSDMRMGPRSMQAQDQPQPEPVSNQPATVLVFRDGHQLEVTNYAIQSGTLFNLSDAGPRKVALADLDVDKTVRANDERGVDFTLPTAR